MDDTARSRCDREVFFQNRFWLAVERCHQMVNTRSNDH